MQQQQQQQRKFGNFYTLLRMNLTAEDHSIPLSDGNSIPLIGLGTYGDPRTVRHKAKCVRLQMYTVHSVTSEILFPVFISLSLFLSS